jgi:hypothetical protein
MPRWTFLRLDGRRRNHSGAKIRSGGAVCAENSVLKASFPEQNYIDVRFMGAGVADFGGGGHISVCAA